MNNEDIKHIVFGASDGATTTMGGIVPLFLSGHYNSIIIAASGTAVASGASTMVTNFTRNKHPSLGRSVAVGAATLLGAIVPLLGFLVYPHDTIPFIISIVCVAILALAVGKARAKLEHESNVRALSLVLVNFLLVSIVAVLVGITASNTQR